MQTQTLTYIHVHACSRFWHGWPRTNPRAYTYSFAHSTCHSFNKITSSTLHILSWLVSSIYRLPPISPRKVLTSLRSSTSSTMTCRPKSKIMCIALDARGAAAKPELLPPSSTRNRHTRYDCIVFVLVCVVCVRGCEVCVLYQQIIT